MISSQIIRNIDAHHTQLINRTRRGNMILAGQTLYVFEVEPAAFAALAANEAEKSRFHQYSANFGGGQFWGDSISVAQSETFLQHLKRWWRRSRNVPGREHPTRDAKGIDMADSKHLRLLQQGAVAWIDWRSRHPQIDPDLSEADLRGANLRGANLSYVTLKKC